MKTLKKLSAMLLAMLLIMSLGTSAFAAAPTGSITINSNGPVIVDGKTFNAYKLLDATFVNGKDAEGGVAYTVPAELNEFYATRYTLNSSAADFGQLVAGKITEEGKNGTLFSFAAAALAAAKEAKVTPVSAIDSGDTAVINNLPFGYYVIEDVGTKTPISALMLNTVGTVELSIKAEMPTIDKNIDGTQDNDPSTSQNVKMNNEAIGDKVPYVLTSKVPSMEGYEKYFFVVNDTLSKGLTFNNDVAITIGGTSLTPDTDFTVSSTTAETGDTVVEIVFKNFIQHKEAAGKPIVITYSATLNENAVIGTEGNPNKVTLTYSNNPNKEASGVPENPDKPGPKDPTGVTPESITKTFVTGIELTKVNSEQKRLTGAEFELKGERLNTVLVYKDEFTVSTDGTFYKLKDGSYTETPPSPEGPNDKYENTEIKYTREKIKETVTNTENVVYKAFVDNDGVLRFDGLAAGTYTITELTAPNGYNILAKPIELTITCNTPELVSGKCTWETTNGKVSADGSIIELSVVNTTGTELPSTGGIGTTIFYIVGGLLVAAAIILLITKKKMSVNE